MNQIRKLHIRKLVDGVAIARGNNSIIGNLGFWLGRLRFPFLSHSDLAHKLRCKSLPDLSVFKFRQLC